MCGKNAIPRVGGRHQAGHYTATKVAYLHGLYPLRLFFSQFVRLKQSQSKFFGLVTILFHIIKHLLVGHLGIDLSVSRAAVSKHHGNRLLWDAINQRQRCEGVTSLIHHFAKEAEILRISRLQIIIVHRKCSRIVASITFVTELVLIFC